MGLACIYYLLHSLHDTSFPKVITLPNATYPSLTYY